VQIAVEDVARSRLEADDLTELDLLLQRDLQILELGGPLGDGVLPGAASRIVAA